MGHHELNFKLGRVWHTPPLKDPTSSSTQHTHKPDKWWPGTRRAYTYNEPRVHASDPHAPVEANVGFDTICNASKSKRFRSTLHAYNEPYIHAFDPHAPVEAKVSSDTICNTSESKLLRSTLHAERTTSITIPLTLSSSHRIKELTRGWWDRL
jgi:hypothetical protein